MFSVKFIHRFRAAASLVLAVAFGQNLVAQEVHLFYNLLNDSLVCQLNGKITAGPKVHRGDRVVVHFTEFNPYLYQANVRVEQSPASSSSMKMPSLFGAFQNLIPGMGGLFGAFSGDSSSALSGPQFPILDAPLLKMGETSISLRGLFSNARGADETLKQAQAELAEIAELRAEAEVLAGQYQSLKKTETALALAEATVEDLPRSPGLRPSSIRQMSEQLFQAAFRPERPGQEVNLNDVFRAQNLPAEKAQVLGKLADKQAAIEAQSAHLEPIANELGNLDLGSDAVIQFSRDLRSVREKSKHLRSQTDAFIAAEKAQSAPGRWAEDLTALYLKLQELRTCPFTHEVAFTAEKDVVDIHAEFIAVDTLGRTSPARSKEIRLETSGGLSISTGFGLVFGGFNSPAQTYSVRSEAIVADNAGVFQPYIASFLHLSKHSAQGWALAGTLGIGLPLRGAGAGQSPAFFLGPSLLLGQGQRVVISGGVLLGEATRLAKGFEVGDAFSSDNGDIPTQQRYEMGLFLGASFRL